MSLDRLHNLGVAEDQSLMQLACQERIITSINHRNFFSIIFFFAQVSILVSNFGVVFLGIIDTPSPKWGVGGRLYLKLDPLGLGIARFRKREKKWLQFLRKWRICLSVAMSNGKFTKKNIWSDLTLRWVSF